MNEELKAECYIGFSKFLKQEMKTFDMKDSMVFEMRVNSMQKKKHTPGLTRKNSNSDKNLSEYNQNMTSKAAIWKEKSISMQKKKVFTEKLWFCGKSVGEINGSITFFNLPILY